MTVAYLPENPGSGLIKDNQKLEKKKVNVNGKVLLTHPPCFVYIAGKRHLFFMDKYYHH